MSAPAPTYDLMLLLDASADEERRTKILGDAEAAVTKAGGEIVSRHDWGSRPTAYEVRKKGEADYHLLQFKGDTELVATLGRTLRITDGVARFRLIKTRGDQPVPDLSRSATPPVVDESEQADESSPAAV